MNDFLKVTAGIYIALFMYLILNKQCKDFSILLSIAVCCVILAVAAKYLEPLINFIEDLKQFIKIDTQILKIMSNSVGIGLLTEITCTICTDAGNSSFGKVLEILASIIILYLSIPLFTDLMEIVEDILIAL